MVNNIIKILIGRDGGYVGLFKIFFITAVGLSFLFASHTAWSVLGIKEAAFQLARADAISNFSKDLAYRKWTAARGGVYTVLNKEIEPNPYLDVPNRDIEATNGLKLTLVNPAWMTRMVHEFSHGVDEESHINITSLKLLNPNNKPDDWEVRALESFEKGVKEVVEVVPYSGKQHLRFMRPLVVEESCLKCHARQGYELGMLRGGISVSVPFDNYLEVVEKNKKINFFWHFFVWAITMGVLFFAYKFSAKFMVNKNQAEAEALNLNLELKESFDRLREEEENRRKIEAEQEKLEIRLRQSEKMEAIGTLAGGIAHDFNNILSAVIGFTELAIYDADGNMKVRQSLEQVLTSSHRATMLVKQILSFSRQNKVVVMPVQVSSILKEVLKLLRATIPSTIEMIANIDEPSLVNADPTQVYQVIMNLCTNAFHAMEESGGRLNISLIKKYLNKDDLKERPEIRPGEYLQLSVCDTGQGIDQKIKERIFEPYFTTKEVGHGSGMGLAIVHGIIASYNGFISVYSEPGKGAAFNVFIPVWSGEKNSNSVVGEAVCCGHERILFVDDESAILSMNESMLTKLGYNVVAKSSSEEAYNLFKNNPDAFDLVITDQTMPGMTGADLAQRIISLRPEIPIILCTGFSSIISEEKAASIGIKKFILKPITLAEISKDIRQVLDKR